MKKEMDQMMCLDIYLSSLTEKENKAIASRIKPSKKGAMAPLLSWDMHISNFYNLSSQSKQETAVRAFEKIAKKLDWKNDIASIFENQEFEALVITDLKKKIVWVSDGFSEMTGYSKKFAIDQTPAFLQGKETTAAVKANLNAKIESDKPFTTIITNYRKDKSPYKCEIKIIPLYSADTTHYLALERKVV
jgi:PAS domain S-box-containing protein